MIAILVIAISFISSAPVTFAKSFPYKVIEDASKTWKITFTQVLQADSVTNASVYILDGNTKIPVRLTLTGSNKSINVTPVTPYEKGKDYELKVESTLKSATGKSLNQPTSMKFQLVDKSSAIQSVSQSSAAGFTNFTVFTRSDVYKVNINTTEMQMAGINKYSQGFYGLKSGTIVTIKAYSETGKVLETKSYTID